MWARFLPKRHCERSEAIQETFAISFWIASSQKTLLAMTSLEPRFATLHFFVKKSSSWLCNCYSECKYGTIGGPKRRGTTDAE